MNACHIGIRSLSQWVSIDSLLHDSRGLLSSLTHRRRRHESSIHPLDRTNELTYWVVFSQILNRVRKLTQETGNSLNSLGQGHVCMNPVQFRTFFISSNTRQGLKIAHHSGLASSSFTNSRRLTFILSQGITIQLDSRFSHILNQLIQLSFTLGSQIFIQIYSSLHSRSSSLNLICLFNNLVISHRGSLFIGSANTFETLINSRLGSTESISHTLGNYPRSLNSSSSTKASHSTDTKLRTHTSCAFTFSINVAFDSLVNSKLARGRLSTFFESLFAQVSKHVGNTTTSNRSSFEFRNQ